MVVYSLPCTVICVTIPYSGRDDERLNSLPTSPMCDGVDRSVASILQCQSLYEVLGLRRSCSREEVKQAYRRLALRFHPDKSEADGSEEAFKLIARAYCVLSSPSRRDEYDLLGGKGLGDCTSEMLPRPRAPHHPGAGPAFRPRFRRTAFHMPAEDLSADDLFRMFFEPGVFEEAFARVQPTFLRRPQRTAPPASNAFATLCRGLPVAIFLIILFWKSTTTPERQFSLTENSPYSARMETLGSQIEYYVSPEARDRLGLDTVSRNNLERLVEQRHMNQLRHLCHVALAALPRDARDVPDSCTEFRNRRESFRTTGVMAR